MKTEWKPDERDIKKVLEAHDLLPEGPLLEEALGLGSLYADRIQKVLEEFPPADRPKAVLAIIEEGLMQEGLIPNKDERKFALPAEQHK